MDGGMDCFLKPEKDPKRNSNLKTMRNYFSIFLGVAIMDRWMDILRHWLVRGKSYNAVMWNWNTERKRSTFFVPKGASRRCNVLTCFSCHPSSNDWHLNALDISFCACHPCHEHNKQLFVEIDIPKRRGGLQFFPESNGTHDPKSFLTPCIDTEFPYVRFDGGFPSMGRSRTSRNQTPRESRHQWPDIHWHVYRWMDAWMDRSMDRWIDGSIDRWIDGSMDRWIDGWTVDR